MSGVTVRREAVVLPTYQPCPADPHPQFIETRVYQGSSGKVYPLPFIDRIEEQKRDQSWDAVWLENEFVQLMVLPELGGRIHVGKDKTSGYDFFYRQDVIKPALVGLAGPWISGGVEFNWQVAAASSHGSLPQHHRPSTFMPCDTHIERDEATGAVTVWCSEHEPMSRMKGMHGVCLRPGSSLIELRVRLYNRTPLTQTFLWWANLAVHVNEHYQSFFPPDVRYVADHAKRAMSHFPECKGTYYGVDYSPGTRLDWYKNIPVPTSYMCCGTDKDFFGGYDHGAGCGVVHVACHHISPGKKQWTWGAHEFGYAWDRNLTDEGGPYIELMAGVYTDNQPDFSFLAPYETKTFSQHWFPIRDIGCAQHANLQGAVSLAVVEAGREARVGVAVTTQHEAALITLERQGQAQPLLQVTTALGPDKPFVDTVPLPEGCVAEELTVRVEAASVQLLLYRPEPQRDDATVPDAATEPPLPQDVASADELYLTGLHLEQYRHPTRDPCLYWREALARDPGDCRCNNALGLWHLRRGELPAAEAHFRTAVARLTARNPNPADGEAHYNLGLALRGLGRRQEAYAALYKATWNYAWRAPAHYALAQIDAAGKDWAAAAQHCRAALATNADCLQARDLCAAVLRQVGRGEEAAELLRGTRALDPLDWWAAHLEGGQAALRCDTQTALDLSLDYAGAGLYAEALSVLEAHPADPSPGTAPLVHYFQAYFHFQLGQGEEEQQCLAAAAAAPPLYVFPARLEELTILQHAVERAPGDARARYYLGCLLYDKRRYSEAVALWEEAVRLQPEGLPSAWRNLGIAYYNVSQDAERATAAYNHAVTLAPDDSRLLYERDQLAKRCRVPPSERLAALEPRMDLVRGRDALAVEVCALYNQLGKPGAAAALLASRRFQPWEGGEGAALGQHVRSHLALGQGALAEGRAEDAVAAFSAALESPHNLGEAKHLLANDSEARYWLGCALDAAGRQEEAATQWEAAAAFQGDFQGMAVCAFSESTLHSALALRRLGREQEARELLGLLLEYAGRLAATPAKIDFFATSLPTMLMFHENLQEQQDIKTQFLEAQARYGLGETATAAELVALVLQRDPAHAQAADLAAEITRADGQNA
ncbi:hypothetical protein ACK3TF_001510 [Chlorella vulgaris]